MLSTQRLESILAALPQLHIGLVGDLFLDRYLEFELGGEECSLETGLAAFQISSVRNQPGALGTVMSNLAALGVGRMTPVTVIGDDGHGFDLLRSLEALPITADHIFKREGRLTPTYTKPLGVSADGVSVEQNRLDICSREPLDPGAVAAVVGSLDALFQQTHGVIVLDQVNEPNWGVVNAEVRAELDARSRSFPNYLVFVDSRTNLGEFRFGTLKGNESEIRAIGGESFNVTKALSGLCEVTGRPAFCTQGSNGILVASPHQGASLVPGIRVGGSVDIVGAGDSATAGIVVALLAGANPLEAAAFGNLVASITVQKMGTTGVATPAELIDHHAQLQE